MGVWTRCVDALNGAVRVAVIAGFALIAALVMAQIVCRYVLLIPLPWSEEAARYLLVWVSLLAAALAFRDDSHIRLDVLLNRLGPRSRRRVAVVLRMIGLGFAALLLTYGISQAKLGRFTNSPGLNISMFAAYCSIPVAAAVMILNILDCLLRQRARGETPPAGQRTGP
jgi:TRAP-type C4-dicarboxylate transport system permease small subunit